MKKFFQKILQYLLKKVVKKSDSNANEVTVPESDPIVLDSESGAVSKDSQDSAVKTKSSWWVTLLRILSYIISLILGGVVTSCANL